MALSADTRPHFTTIADFISSLGDEIIVLYCIVHNLLKIHRYGPGFA
jgi:hypothetical protein